MEGEDTAQQCYLAVLAHAVYPQAEHAGVPVRIAARCGHSQQTRSRCAGGKVLEKKAGRRHRRVQEMAHVPPKSDPRLRQGWVGHVK